MPRPKPLFGRTPNYLGRKAKGVLFSAQRFLTKFVPLSLIINDRLVRQIIWSAKTCLEGNCCDILHAAVITMQWNSHRWASTEIKLNYTRGGRTRVYFRKCSGAEQPKWGWGISPVKLSSFPPSPPLLSILQRATHCYGPLLHFK